MSTYLQLLWNPSNDLLIPNEILEQSLLQRGLSDVLPDLIQNFQSLAVDQILLDLTQMHLDQLEEIHIAGINLQKVRLWILFFCVGQMSKRSYLVIRFVFQKDQEKLKQLIQQARIFLKGAEPEQVKQRNHILKSPNADELLRVGSFDGHPSVLPGYQPLLIADRLKANIPVCSHGCVEKLDSVNEIFKGDLKVSDRLLVDQAQVKVALNAL